MMMREFQKNTELILLIQDCLDSLRRQDYFCGLLELKQAAVKLNELVTGLLKRREFYAGYNIEPEEGLLVAMLKDLLQAQENEDYVLLADLFELQILPFLIQLQEQLQKSREFSLPQYEEENLSVLSKRYPDIVKKIENITAQDTAAETTSVGLNTFYVRENDRRFYMHSNGNPYQEGKEFAKAYAEPGIHTYLVYGLGFAYHINGLLDAALQNRVLIFESNLQVIKLASRYARLVPVLESGRAELIYTGDFQELSRRLYQMQEGEAFLLHRPSMRAVKSREIREMLEDYFVLHSTVKNQAGLLDLNFSENRTAEYEFADCLKERFEGKSLILAAGGPSLDRNMEYLKKRSEESILICAGTVFKKLLAAEIRPDYVMISDPQKHMAAQTAGVGKEQAVPLLCLPTVSHEVVRAYPAKKYFLLQEGYPPSEELARQKGKRLFCTGGSVMTTALELGIQFGCRRIICVGLDLAYTRGQTHASGVSYGRQVDTAAMRQAEGYDGGQVATTKNLDSYRKWIERRIKETEGIEFINATEGGAKIAGMKQQRLKDLEEIAE